jgi:hypothetical protein
MLGARAARRGQVSLHSRPRPRRRVPPRPQARRRPGVPTTPRR